MIQMLPGPIAGLLGKGIDRAIPDQAEAARIKTEAMREILTSGQSALESQTKVILAEAQGESWLQRNWRPILMRVIVGIVADNDRVAPWLALLGLVSVRLELPERMWDLMTLGVGGCIVGRSGEKMVRARAEKP